MFGVRSRSSALDRVSHGQRVKVCGKCHFLRALLLRYSDTSTAGGAGSRYLSALSPGTSSGPLVSGRRSVRVCPPVDDCQRDAPRSRAELLRAGRQISQHSPGSSTTTAGIEVRERPSPRARPVIAGRGEGAVVATDERRARSRTATGWPPWPASSTPTWRFAYLWREIS